MLVESGDVKLVDEPERVKAVLRRRRDCLGCSDWKLDEGMAYVGRSSWRLITYGDWRREERNVRLIVEKGV